MFITFEGVEGSGKTTQVARLQQALTAAGYAVWKTREPGGTPLAEAIRQIVLTPDRAIAALATTAPPHRATPPAPEGVTAITELLLMNAARAQLVQEIERRRALGEIVLCDRFADATLAYQGGGRGIPRATIAPVIALAVGTTWPDLTILLDIDPRVGLARKSATASIASDWNRLDDEALEFHQRVRATYLTLAAEEPARWLTLDASAPPDAIAATIWTAVAQRRANRA